MLGTFRLRNCKCKKKRCTCGAKWHYRYDIIDPLTGKRKQKETRGFRTKAEAEEEAKRIQYELQTGVYVNEKNTTFIEFVPEFLKLYAATGKVKSGSIRVRQSRCKKLTQYFGHIKLKDITKTMYQNMLIDLKEKGYAKESIISIHATAKLLFKKAIELELIKSNPTLHVIIPQDQLTVEQLESSEKLPSFMEKEELLLFLDAAKKYGLDEQDYPILVVLAYTGMRVGELCALKWADIDITNKTISITKTIDNEKNNTMEYKLVPPKTRSSVRTIEISNTVINVLEDHKHKQNILKMKHRNAYHDNDFIFTKNNDRFKYYGYPFMQKDIGSRMKRILKLGGLNTKMTPHSLRHTHTSLLAEVGVQLETIQERLGHKDDDITRNVYLHITRELKREASQKFDELMGSLN